MILFRIYVTTAVVVIIVVFFFFLILFNHAIGKQNIRGNVSKISVSLSCYDICIGNQMISSAIWNK